MAVATCGNMGMSRGSYVRGWVFALGGYIQKVGFQGKGSVFLGSGYVQVEGVGMSQTWVSQGEGRVCLGVHPEGLAYPEEGDRYFQSLGILTPTTGIKTKWQLPKHVRLASGRCASYWNAFVLSFDFRMRVALHDQKVTFFIHQKFCP